MYGQDPAQPQQGGFSQFGTASPSPVQSNPFSGSFGQAGNTANSTFAANATPTTGTPQLGSPQNINSAPPTMGQSPGMGAFTGAPVQGLPSGINHGSVSPLQNPGQNQAPGGQLQNQINPIQGTPMQGINQGSVAHSAPAQSTLQSLIGHIMGGAAGTAQHSMSATSPVAATQKPAEASHPALGTLNNAVKQPTGGNKKI